LAPTPLPEDPDGHTQLKLPVVLTHASGAESQLSVFIAHSLMSMQPLLPTPLPE
jgi:hypothetical protein